MLSDEEKRALSKVRLEHANDALREAQSMFSADHYRGACNRSYYAVFHAMRSVLALHGIDRKHHSGVISEFRRMYIKTGVFDRNLSESVQKQSMYRESSDYNDLFAVSREEASELVADAERFLSVISEYLRQNIGL